jgi:hypothetical protein
MPATTKLVQSILTEYRGGGPDSIVLTRKPTKIDKAKIYLFKKCWINDKPRTTSAGTLEQTKGKVMHRNDLEGSHEDIEMHYTQTAGWNKPTS